MQSISSGPSYSRLTIAFSYRCASFLSHGGEIIEWPRIGERERERERSLFLNTVHNNYCVVARRQSFKKFITSSLNIRPGRIENSAARSSKIRRARTTIRDPPGYSATPWSRRLNINPDDVRYSGNNSGGFASCYININCLINVLSAPREDFTRRVRGTRSRASSVSPCRRRKVIITWNTPGCLFLQPSLNPSIFPSDRFFLQGTRDISLDNRFFPRPLVCLLGPLSRGSRQVNIRRISYVDETWRSRSNRV